MKIISGTAHPQLAKDIAKELGLPLCDATVNAFPDGESFVQINESIRGEDVFIVQPTCPPTNHNL
ncbi:MAG: ribose-phosphate pyrophosphokinase-like domain-containing protein, partial [Akkermansia sp.]|nr:ribose-phosphate pyrophosphokinase-like domain-containing protein [Akkermansia sp.]